MVVIPKLCLFESIPPEPQRVSGMGGYYFKNQEVMPVACKKCLMATESTEVHGKIRIAKIIACLTGYAEVLKRAGARIMKPVLILAFSHMIPRGS